MSHNSYCIILGGTCCQILPLFFFKILFIFGEGKGGKKGGKPECVVSSRVPPTGDLAHNPGTCPRLLIEPVTLQFAGWHSIH